MKTVFLALLTLSLLVLQTSAAQAYDPYYYEPHLQHSQQHDPYYTLHLIHYQLYRPQFYHYPSYLAYPVQVFVIRGHSKQIRPQPQESRK